jgi:hypothetical protein
VSCVGDFVSGARVKKNDFSPNSPCQKRIFYASICPVIDDICCAVYFAHFDSVSMGSVDHGRSNDGDSASRINREYDN